MQGHVGKKQFWEIIVTAFAAPLGSKVSDGATDVELLMFYG